jgi:hypothetical protein
VTLTDEFGCTDKTDAGVSITVLGLPTAKISITGSKNICPGETRLLTATFGVGYSYQWMKDGVDIPLAILPTYIAFSGGNYQCEVTDINGCSKISTTIVIKEDCKIGDEESFSGDKTIALKIYPNPATDLIHVELLLQDSEGKRVAIEIRNMLGAAVYSYEETLTGSAYTIKIPLQQDLANGIYLLTVKYDEQFAVQKFVISK